MTLTSATLLLAAAAGAQQRAEPPATARYSAVVRDALGNPVPRARVRAQGHHIVLTDGRGAVVLDSLPVGTQVIEFLALGFMPERRVVKLRAETSPVDTVVLKALAPGLDTVRVTADEDPTGFNRRRHSVAGQFITAADIEREDPRNVTALLRTRERMRYSLDRAGTPAITMTTGPGSGCRPLVLLDGFPLPPAPRMTGIASLDWIVHPDEIGGVEIYTNPGQVPAQFSLLRIGSCGAILIWTREMMDLPNAPRGPRRP